MRRFNAILAAAAITACLAIVGCASSQPQASSSAAESSSQETEQASYEFVGGNDPMMDFAANSGAIELSSDENSCYSPASYFLALGMVAVGADGQAQQQMFDVMGLDTLSALNQYCKEQADEIGQTDEESTIQVANSLWSNTGYTFQQQYLDAVQEYFDAGAFDIQFGTQQTNDMIRDWISENTRGLLEPNVSTDANMVAMLINTIYFKDAWIEPFVEGDTEEGVFHADGQDIQVPFMHNVTDYNTYIEGENFTAAQMPFSGGSTATFYLPNEGTSVDDLIGTPDAIQSLLVAEPNSNAQISWSLPRFEITSKFEDLADCAETMGITDIFDPGIKDMFRNMIVGDTPEDDSFYVSDVLQETFMSLDEFGVEAAAYTSMMVRATSLAPEPQEIVEFVLDRPFVYTITASNGAPLFIGVVANPAA